MTDVKKIQTFLHFGYLPIESKDLISQILDSVDLHAIQGRKIEYCDESTLVEKGIQSLKASFQNMEDGLHIVPLSGGLDSRTILGGLIDSGVKDRIIAVTFGTPGTYDYDLGCYVAKKTGINHETFDLTKIRVGQDLLLHKAREGGSWTFLIDAYYNSLIYEKFGNNVTYWSGFMGDPLAGSHLLQKDSPNWKIALHEFIMRNKLVDSISLIPPDFHPEDLLPQSPIIGDNKYLTYDEQLDFAIRQESYVKRVAIPPSDYNYQLPFLEAEWINFILSVPRQYRAKQYIYKRILMKAYPELFSLPTKNTMGLPLNAPRWHLKIKSMIEHMQQRIRGFIPLSRWITNPMINYIDFDTALRERDDFIRLVYENIYNLKARKIIDWLDIDKIWQNHQRKKANHGMALMLLTALEISLIADSEIN